MKSNLYIYRECDLDEVLQDRPLPKLFKIYYDTPKTLKEAVIDLAYKCCEGDGTESSVKKIFLDNLPDNISSDEEKQLFQHAIAKEFTWTFNNPRLFTGLNNLLHLSNEYLDYPYAFSTQL